MPILGDNDNMEAHNLQVSNYGFSAKRIEDLGASEYTLVGIAADASSSVSDFEAEIHNCLKEIVLACRQSPRADNLMMRLIQFSSEMRELHGFRPLTECDVDTYGSILSVGGMTALYDASTNLVESVSAYGKDLSVNDYDVNAIVFVVTDGMDNRSTFTPKNVKNAIGDSLKSEHLESILSILIGVNINDKTVSQYLNDFNKEAGFSQYVELGGADAKTLARLADFVSRSISAQSQALGTGGPSKSLSF